MNKLRERHGPSREFEAIFPRQSRLIRALLNPDPNARPTALQILNGDCLPPKVEDEYVRDILRQVGQDSSTLRKRVLHKLFNSDNPREKLAPSNSPRPPRMEDPETWKVRHRVIGSLRKILEESGAVEVPTKPVISSNDAIFRRSDTASWDAVMTASGNRYLLRQNLFSGFVLLAATLDCNLTRYEFGTVWTSTPEKQQASRRISMDSRGDIDDIGYPDLHGTSCLQLDSVLLSTWAPAKVELVHLTRKIAKILLLTGTMTLRLGHSGLTRTVLSKCGAAESDFVAISRIAGSRQRDWSVIRKDLVDELGLQPKVIDKIGSFEMAKGEASTFLLNLCHLLHTTGRKSRAVPEVEKFLNHRTTSGEQGSQAGSSKRSSSTSLPDMSSEGRTTVASAAAGPLDELAVVLHYLNLVQCGEDHWDIVLDPLLLSFDDGDPSGQLYDGVLFEIHARMPSVSDKYESIACGGDWTPSLQSMQAKLEKEGSSDSSGRVSFACGVTIHLETILKLSLEHGLHAEGWRQFAEQACDVYVCGGSSDRRVSITCLLRGEGIRAQYLHKANPTMAEQRKSAIAGGASWLVLLGNESGGQFRIKNLYGRKDSSVSVAEDELVSRLHTLVANQKST
eukprot:Plantae.Rhodophyta-Rhodochaete_pulchella.ctg1085.p1 GENE.Plantae.Rhodophyta-Rhodochaete_pulchella.ctg1085~~Plantae.Rhodophyta-Rhodochaete_pulchella.ctg1085.p1  ORF type:complete len:622 (-),score=92.61 Plantae.Rhodophyta-Rhodochaete_pulchella.ctg1085:109-1974(-)